MTTTWKFPMNSKLRVLDSDREGVVERRAENSDGTKSYLLHLDGSDWRDWFGEDQLALVGEAVAS